MYSKDKNTETGKYLRKTICHKCTSIREFCRIYLRLLADDDSYEPDDIDIQRITNKMSQIFNGNKSVQTEDLPYFSEILGVDIAEILSAGKYKTNKTSRPTNLSTALSSSEKVWNDYINSGKGQALFCDEYNKSIIDYALDFGNYNLMKYLTENGNIVWSSDAIKINFPYPVCKYNTYMYNSESCVEMRNQLIHLAVENNDTDMLKQLHAREYWFFEEILCSSAKKNDELFKNNYDQKLIDHIVRSDDPEVLKYFSESFKTENRILMVFPYIENLIKYAIKNSSNNVRKMLESLLEHNSMILSCIKDYLYSTFRMHNPGTIIYEEHLNEWKNFIYHPFISHSVCSNVPFIYSYGNIEWYAFLVVRLDIETSDPDLSKLITEINSLYSQIAEFNDKSEELTEQYLLENYEIVEETI